MQIRLLHKARKKWFIQTKKWWGWSTLGFWKGFFRGAVFFPFIFTSKKKAIEAVKHTEEVESL